MVFNPFDCLVKKSDFNEFGTVKSKLFTWLLVTNPISFFSGQDHTIRDRGCDIAISKSNLCVSLCKIVSWLTHLIMHWFLGSTETAAEQIQILLRNVEQPVLLRSCLLYA